MLPLALACLTYAHLRGGRVLAAYAAATEALDLAHDTRGTTHGIAMGILALTEALLGREADARSHARQARRLYT